MTTATPNPIWWIAPRASLSTLDGNANSKVVFPLQTPSADGSSLRGGILTVELHSATRMGPLLDPEVADERSLYAVLDCEDFQTSARAAWWSEGRGAALWRNTLYHFDVTTSPELVVHLFATTNKDQLAPHIEPLGRFIIRGSQDGYPVGKTSADIQGATGQVELTVSHLQQKVASLGDRNIWGLPEVYHDKFANVFKKDTRRPYALAAIHLGAADAAEEFEKTTDLTFSISHPFVAPLKFAFTSSGRVDLLSPLASGGYLSHHLQRKRRFDVDKARFYAAELILMLEHLHSKHMICASLEPVQLLLDAYGHINLCDPAMYSRHLMTSSAVECALPASLEYTAPELLSGHEATIAIDWWMLGILVHEMMTGLPPFYHKNVEEQRDRIISQTVQLPPGFPLHASDLIATLLKKDPLRRLGTNGASEVKAHPFFRNLDWQRLYQRDDPTPYQPVVADAVFRLDPIQRDMNKRPMRRLSQGTIYEYRDSEGFGWGVPFWWQPIGHQFVETKQAADNKAWSLTWDTLTSRLYFTHQVTGEELFVDTDSPARASAAHVHTVTAASPTERGEATHNLPTKEQLKNALKLSLEIGHGSNLVAQIIQYGIDLNTSILPYDHVPDDTGITFDLKDEIAVTPLEWATEHNRLDLVALLLENGADANYTCNEVYGPALVRAVHRNASQLAPPLVVNTNRVAATKALCAAVERQDALTVEMLLARDVQCDFEEVDLPSPPDPFCQDHDTPVLARPRWKAEDFLAPLVRAVRLGNVSLVRLLLANGADANVGYHCGSGGLLPLPHRQHSWKEETVPIQVNFACGRAVQLAMELGHDAIVRLLLQSGADVRLPQPVRINQDHTCPLVPRAVWLDVISRLEELRANVKPTP